MIRIPNNKKGDMMSSIIYYHAGCPVCIEAERTVVSELQKVSDVTIVNLGEDKADLAAAKSAGVESVPALVINGLPFHINFGASMSALES